MKHIIPIIVVIVLLAAEAVHADEHGAPLLYRHVEVPAALCADEGYAGDIRMGDLTGNGVPDFITFRSVAGGMKPCFIGAFTMEGEVLWRVGSGGGQPVRPGPVTLYDFDADGRDEVLCFFHDPAVDAPDSSMADVVVQVRSGADGTVIREAVPPEITSCAGSGPNWVHQRLFVADFRGSGRPADFVVKLGSEVVAMTGALEVLWTYHIPWNEYSRCSAYIPSVGDIDCDGRDEVNGGYYILDEDGAPRFEGRIGRHMDSVAITAWEGGTPRAVASGFGHILDKDGGVILMLGEELVPHGQEARVGEFVPGSPGPEMNIRWNGHNTDVMTVAATGDILHRFNLNSSPNETGMETIHWNGADGFDLLYNGGMLWRGTGELFAELPGLPDEKGPAKMGWYHCIPGNVCGDCREETVVYNPWDRGVWIFTPAPLDEGAFEGYSPGPRQYNARLMD